MRTVFIGYKFTGVPLKEIYELVDPLFNALNIKYTPYCNLYDIDFYVKNKYNTRQIMEHSLNKLSECNFHVVIVDNKEISQGMCIEVGWSFKENKIIILIIRDGITASTLESMANHVIRYKDINEMTREVIEQINI